MQEELMLRKVQISRSRPGSLASIPDGVEQWHPAYHTNAQNTKVLVHFLEGTEMGSSSTASSMQAETPNCLLCTGADLKRFCLDFCPAYMDIYTSSRAPR